MSLYFCFSKRGFCGFYRYSALVVVVVAALQELSFRGLAWTFRQYPSMPSNHKIRRPGIDRNQELGQAYFVLVTWGGNVPDHLTSLCQDVNVMLQLPVKLQRQCVEYLHDDINALKAVRLMNREFKALATNSLFRTVVLTIEDESADKFTNVVQSSLVSLVRRVIINTFDPSEDYSDCESDEDNETAVMEIPAAFGAVLLKIGGFPNLEEVEVRYTRACHGVTIWSQ